jgi:hypothetical protein
MFNKKRLIAVLVLVAAMILIVIAVTVVVGMLFMRSSGNTVAMASATAVGVPNGKATTKSIGPAGGSLASADGRITIDVPPNAVPSPLNFSIQPITNLAQGGMGNAYRLQPDGLKFATPIKVSFNFDAPDLKETIPEGLAVAYQDPTGVWQAFDTVNLDRERKSLTVSTTHFTDFSIWAVKLSPEKATLRVGQTVEIQLVACLENSSWLSRLRTRWGIQRCDSLTKSTDNHWSVDIGTITPAGPGFAVYQAPAVKPPKGVATVRFVYKAAGSTEKDLKDVRECEITIVGNGYRATGSDGPTSYSGTICSLDKEFTVIGHNGPLDLTFKFTPSGDGRAGIGTLGGSVSVATWTGNGPYTIEAFGSDKPKIMWVTHQTVSGKFSGSGTFHIELVPLDTDEKCK